MLPPPYPGAPPNTWPSGLSYGGYGYAVSAGAINYYPEFASIEIGIEVDFDGPRPQHCEASFDRGGAFITVNPATGAVGYHLTSNSSRGSIRFASGGGTEAHPQEIVGAEIPTASDLLEQSSSRSWAHTIDPRSGALSYSADSVLTTGSVNGLSLSLNLASGAHGIDDTPWSHNWSVQADVSSSGLEAMGQSRPDNAIPSLVAFAAMQDIYATGGSGVAASLRREIGGVFAVNWWINQLENNVVTISTGSAGQRFVRRVDGDFNPPLGTHSVLQESGSRHLPSRDDDGLYWDYSDVDYALIDANGNRLDFAYSAARTAPRNYANGEAVLTEMVLVPNNIVERNHSWLADHWAFEAGNEIDFTYQSAQVVQLARVETGLGWALSFDYADDESFFPISVAEAAPWISNPRSVSFDDTSITYPDGTVTNFEFVAPPASPRIAAHGSWLTAITQPEDAVGSPSFRFSYDSLGRVNRFEELAENGSTYNPYNYFIALGHRTEILDPTQSETSPTELGVVTYFDRYGRTSRTIDRRATLTQFTYDGLGRQIALHTRGLAHPTTYFWRGTETVYDAHDNVIAERAMPRPAFPDIASLEAPLVTQTFYNQPGYPTWPTRTIDANGNTASITCYSSATTEPECAALPAGTLDASTRGGLPQAVLGPEGEQALFEYNALGQVTRQRVLVSE